MIHPYKIPKEKMPLIVLSDHTSGFVQWAIKFRTQAAYNHIMLQLFPGEFVSQGNTFSAVPLERYVKKNSRLKYWIIKDIKECEINRIGQMVHADLRGSWWSKKYDYTGIIGQLLGLKKFNFPGKMYCSERVARYLYQLEGFENVPRHGSPKDLNEYFKGHPRMEVYGRWAAD